MKELILVRHGQTIANAGGLLQGHIDNPLNELGKAQAERVAQVVGHLVQAGAHVISSPLVRAQMTASAFAQEVQVDQSWIELNYGDYDAKPLTDVPTSVWKQWRADLDFAPPNGESLRALGTRVRASCERLAEVPQDTVIVVSHVSPIKAAVTWALGVSDSASWRMNLQPASITRIGFSGHGPSLQRFNSIEHLDGL